MIASAVNRARYRPFVLGGLAMLQGYFGAMLRGSPRQADSALIRFIRDYQLRALRMGKAQAVAQIEAERAPLWQPAAGQARLSSQA